MGLFVIEFFGEGGVLILFGWKYSFFATNNSRDIAKIMEFSLEQFTSRNKFDR